VSSEPTRAGALLDTQPSCDGDPAEGKLAVQREISHQAAGQGRLQTARAGLLFERLANPGAAR